MRPVFFPQLTFDICYGKGLLFSQIMLNINKISECIITLFLVIFKWILLGWSKRLADMELCYILWNSSYQLKCIIIKLICCIVVYVQILCVWVLLLLFRNEICMSITFCWFDTCVATSKFSYFDLILVSRFRILIIFSNRVTAFIYHCYIS